MNGNCNAMFSLLPLQTETARGGGRRASEKSDRDVKDMSGGGERWGVVYTIKLNRAC